MSKNLKIKESTLEKIRQIIEDNGGVTKFSKKKLKNSKEFDSMLKGHSNKHERGVMEKILSMIYDGKMNDEILLILDARQTDSNSSEIEAETEAMFIRSKDKVVEGPIVVETINEDDEENNVVDAVFTDVDSESEEKMRKDEFMSKSSELLRTAIDKIIENNVSEDSLKTVNKFVSDIIDTYKDGAKNDNSKEDNTDDEYIEDGPVFIKSKDTVVESEGITIDVNNRSVDDICSEIKEELFKFTRILIPRVSPVPCVRGE